jgi:hypothetical protein
MTFFSEIPYYLRLHLLSAFSASAQFESPVKWKVTALPISEDTYEIRLKATIADKHYIYSTDIPEDEGPVATSVKIQPRKILR